MDAPRLLTLLGLAAVTLAVAAPLATAHTPAFSADDRVRASIGLLNEPVSTYMSTGLDICFTENVPAPRPPVAIGNLANLTATLKAPDGQAFTAPLAAQFGRAGCLSFNQPLVLTQPGQYTVDLSGSINGTTFDAKGINAGGPVRDRADITFPDEGVASNLDLQQRLANAEARLATLEATAEEHGDEKGAPAPAAALLLVGLAALAAVRRLR